jgi:hypothetical protein
MFPINVSPGIQGKDQRNPGGDGKFYSLFSGSSPR